MRTLLVVGAGISGLSAARAARAEADANGIPLHVIVAEASDRVGGVIRTTSADGRPLEWGADGFVAGSAAEDLCDDHGLEMVDASPGGTCVWRGGRLRPVPPDGALGILTGPRAVWAAVRHGAVSPGTAARATLEPFRRRSHAGATVGEVTRRRFGTGVVEDLVDPLARAIFGVPADVLAIDVAPALVEPGSLLLRALRQAAPATRFRTVVGGMERLPAVVAGALRADVRTSATVGSLRLRDRRWIAPAGDDELVVDGVLLTVGPHQAASILDRLRPAKHLLRSVTIRSTAVVHAAWPSAAFERLAVRGIVTDPREPGVVAAATILGARWPHLSGSGRVRISLRPDAVPDDATAARASDEVGAMLGIQEAPSDLRLHLWEGASVPPTPANRRLIGEVRGWLPPTIGLAGPTAGAGGVPAAIATGATAARALVRHLAGAATGRSERVADGRRTS